MASVLEEKDAIRELLARYCFTVDSGNFDEWANLFTEDGVCDLGPMGCFSGRENLRRFAAIIPLVDGKPTMRHCVMNSIIDVHGTEATAQSYVVVVNGHPSLAVMVAGRYEDQLVKDGDDWRFKVRRAQIDFLTVPES